MSSLLCGSLSPYTRGGERVKVVLRKKPGDHLLAKKSSGDLWPWRRNRRQEWADALRRKLSVRVSQEADKCATIADKEQNDNTWHRPSLLFFFSLFLFNSQLLLLLVRGGGRLRSDVSSSRETRTPNILPLLLHVNFVG